ncbi:MAG: DUF6356 family protein [Pseudomonadota bacterium]
MEIKRKFTEHPESVGETYGQHFVSAMSFSVTLLKAAAVCGVHALLPFLFEKTGSRCVTELYDRMVANRDRRPEAAEHEAAA